MRALFEVLFALDGAADGGGAAGGRLLGFGGGGAARDDVHIVIRKYASHAELACKRVGIIGGVAFIVARSGRFAEAAYCNGAPDPNAPPNTLPILARKPTHIATLWR